MEERNYTMEGWLAITSACLMVPVMILGILVDTALHRFPGIVAVEVLFTIIQAGLSIYVFYRFKQFLNEKFQFRDVDNLIIYIIAGSILITMVGILGRLFVSPDDIKSKLIFLAAIILVGIPTAILGIVFAVRLLRLPDDLRGLLKPYAYITIIGSAFFLTIILALLGLLLMAVTDLLLGMIYLRSSQEVQEIEYV